MNDNDAQDPIRLDYAGATTPRGDRVLPSDIGHAVLCAICWVAGAVGIVLFPGTPHLMNMPQYEFACIWTKAAMVGAALLFISGLRRWLTARSSTPMLVRFATLAAAVLAALIFFTGAWLVPGNMA